MSDYERLHHSGSALNTVSVSLQPVWSLPAKVMNIHKGQLEIKMLGQENRRSRKVPLKYVMKMPYEIPASIASLNIQNILIDTPREYREIRRIPEESSMSVDEMISKSYKRDKGVLGTDDVFYANPCIIDLDVVNMSNQLEAKGYKDLINPMPEKDRELLDNVSYVDVLDIFEAKGYKDLTNPMPEKDPSIIERNENVGYAEIVIENRSNRIDHSVAKTNGLKRQKMSRNIEYSSTTDVVSSKLQC